MYIIVFCIFRGLQTTRLYRSRPPRPATATMGPNVPKRRHFPNTIPTKWVQPYHGIRMFVLLGKR